MRHKNGWTIGVCVECGMIFQYPRRHSNKKFHAQSCNARFHNIVWKRNLLAMCRFDRHNDIEYTRKIAGKHAYNALPGTFGMYALEVDPWITGQLPMSVRANALWG